MSSDSVMATDARETLRTIVAAALAAVDLGLDADEAESGDGEGD